MNLAESHSHSLSPAQSKALKFLNTWSGSPVLHLCCPESRGKTTVLRQFARQNDAFWLDARPFVEEVAKGHPFAIEEAIHRLLTSTFASYPKVVIDDFNLLYDFAGHCGSYPRTIYFESVMKAIQLAASEANCQIVIASNGQLPDAFANLAWSTSIGSFTADDYRHLFQAILGELPDLDFATIHQFAPHLNCHRISYLCHWLGREDRKITENLLEFIQKQGMSSNVDIAEVQSVELQDLCGVDEVVEALEDNIILPIENLQLASELGLTPKRGVMLAGPPGTGKTTIGRALAHRMRGKFFLIDGTVISGTEHFYYRIDRIFDLAIANAPSIVFIDDSDVIFESGREHGLYRYLLTKLDGLESESVSNVCVMMTAMDLGNIPPALVRSGRIELWLEMKLPDAASRRQLMQRLMTSQFCIETETAWSSVVEATSGFSGADLKRLLQDAKLRMAVDLTRNRPLQSVEVYLLAAASSIQDSRRAYAKASRRAIEANENRPRWFNIHPELFETANLDQGGSAI